MFDCDFHLILLISAKIMLSVLVLWETTEQVNTLLVTCRKTAVHAGKTVVK